MSYRCRILKDSDNVEHLSVAGVGYGPEGLKVIAKNIDSSLIIVKNPGHSYWADRMTGNEYAPTTYIVYALSERTGDPSSVFNLSGEELKEIEPGKNWKKELDDLCKKYECKLIEFPKKEKRVKKKVFSCKHCGTMMAHEGFCSYLCASRYEERKLKAKLLIYEKALTWYADKDNHYNEDGAPFVDFVPGLVLELDEGAIARKALEDAAKETGEKK